MNNKRYLKYYLLSLAGLAAACAYPIYMGIKVILLVISSGAVPYKEYPKYIIPYTPIAVSDRRCYPHAAHTKALQEVGCSGGICHSSCRILCDGASHGDEDTCHG